MENGTVTIPVESYDILTGFERELRKECKFFTETWGGSYGRDTTIYFSDESIDIAIKDLKAEISNLRGEVANLEHDLKEAKTAPTPILSKVRKLRFRNPIYIG